MKSNYIWGIVLLIIGIILGLNALEITAFSIFFPGWWTLLFIIPNAIKFMKGKANVADNIVLAIAILILLSYYAIIAIEVVWKLIIPIMFIMFGLSFLFKSSISKEVNKKIEEINKKNNNKEENEYCSTFTGQKIDFSDEEFKGGTFTSVFGGMEVNLKDAIIKEDVVINASATFGGVNIILPKDVNVKIKSNSMFGGVENNYDKKSKSKITIYVNATCLFGGVEIND